MILRPLDSSFPASDGDDFDGMSPQCSECLSMMEPQQSTSGEYWTCPRCGVSKLS